MRTPETEMALRPRLGATLIFCSLLIAVLVASVGRLTQGFELWTYESLRRQQAIAGRLYAPPMALRDARDQPLALFAADAHPAPGSVYLVDFIYTRCLTICQALGSEHYRMQESLRVSRDRVSLLSVSIDPLNDDASALDAHGRLHRADASLWVLAAPQSEGAGRAALRQLGVVAIPDGQGGFAHNGSLHLVDAGGRVHRVFDYGQWEQALAAAQSLAAERVP